MNDTLLELYQRVILDHSKRPRHQGKLVEAGVRHLRGINPNCGDEVELWFTLDAEDRLEKLQFTGQGCAISQASASLLAEKLQGKRISELPNWLSSVQALVQGQSPSLSAGELGELSALQGVSQFPRRVPCALLAWNAMREGIPNLALRAQPPHA